MKKQKLLLLLLTCLLYFSSRHLVVGARALPPVSYLSPLPSSFASPPFSSPISSSMAAFSPGPLESIGGAKMDKFRRLILAVIIASASAGMLMLSVLALWIYHQKISNKACRKNGGVKGFAPAQPKGGFNPLRMNSSRRAVSVDYKLLETATDKFDESNKLSNGEFGCIYKAKFNDGRYVAVKKIKGGEEDDESEFENEVGLLNKIQHPNIITLLGYCIHEDSRYTVYELMEKGSLETQLHGPSRGSDLTWHIRMKIALDVARGLEYLHELCRPAVIYRDLKSANILLDSNFNAKLGHFGVAVTEGYQNKKKIKLPGTSACVAPEYASDGKLSDKTDVYAFGVVLLELLLGRKPVENPSTSEYQSIVKWAMPQLTDRSKLPSIVDPVIRDTMDLKHLYQVAAVAVLCVQAEPSYRPLITDVLHSLIPLVPVELGGALRVQPN